VQAITHDSRNYVVDADKCNLCMACVPPCPTGSIDNWRTMPKVRAYSVADQLGWDSLPGELAPEALAAEAGDAAPAVAAPTPAAAVEPGTGPAFSSAQFGSTMPPWSAAHAYTNLYGPKAADRHVVATVTGNVRVTEVGREYDTHHVVLDFGAMPFPVLEGQSIAVIPPGTDASGRPHHPRQYRWPARATASGRATTTCR
jgi:benzoyl-CoA 2,3-dioxygenase component A